MYIHIYTTATSTYNTKTLGPDSEIHVWWYSRPTESTELFKDYQKLLAKLHEYKEFDKYTGDILEVEDENTFNEKLILLGITIPAEDVTINLKGEELLKMNYGVLKYTYHDKCNSYNQFTDLYNICFGDYSIIETFSYNSKIPNINIASAFVRIQDMKGNYIYIQGVQFYELEHTFLKTNTSYFALNTWFSHTINYNSYCKCNLLLERMYQYNQELSSKELVQQSSQIESENQELKSEDQQKDSESPQEYSYQQKQDIDWIEEFCRLYAEADPKVDTLLSDAYQQYVTASQWTETPTVNMQTFIKHIKQMQQFTVKRKAKGMVIVGFKFLVDEQEDMYNKAKKGELCERNLLVYLNDQQLTTMINGIPKEFIGGYYLESKILLNKAVQTSDMMIKQFYNNPYIKKSLPLFSKYIAEVREKDSFESKMQLFREFSQKCTIYCPFSTQIFTYRVNTVKSCNDIRYDVPIYPNSECLKTNKTIKDNIPEPFDPYSVSADSIYESMNENETDIKNILNSFQK